MDDKIEVNVDFIINNQEVMAEAAKVKNQVIGIADTAEEAVGRVNESVKTILSYSQKEVGDYANSINSATEQTVASNKVSMADDDLTPKQVVDKLKLDIIEQKKIFDEFEKYKLEFGVQKATERFKKELEGFTSYTLYLRSLVPAPTDKSKNADAVRDYLNKKAIPEAEIDEGKRTIDNTNKELKRVLASSETAAIKKLSIEKKYTDDVALLKADTTIDDTEKEARIKKLDDIKAIELKANQQIADTESGFYKAAMKDVTNASLAELKQRIKEAKKELSREDLTSAQRLAIGGQLTNAQKGLAAAGIIEDKYGQDIKQNSQTSAQALKISEYAKAASGSFYEMAAALKDIAPGTADTLQTLGDIAAVAGNAAKSVASFATGDIVGGVTGAITTVAGIFAIGAKARASEKKAQTEVKAFQDSILQGEIALNIEMRTRARTQGDINELTSVELAAKKELLATQSDQAQTDYEKQLALVQAGNQKTNIRTEQYGGVFGIGRKTRTVFDTTGVSGLEYEQLEALSIAGKLDEATEKLFQGLKKSKNEMDAIGESADELTATLTNKLTGGLTADSISSTIVQGYKDGKRAVTEFADYTEEIIKQALLSALAYNLLSEPLKKLVAQFGEDSLDGLSDDEIQKFKDGLGAATDVFLKATDAVEKSTGISLSDGNSSSTVSASKVAMEKVLTEDSVNVYIGIARGAYDLQKQTLNVQTDNQGIFRGQWLTLKAIETNTGLIADNTTGLGDKLDQIITNTKTKVSNSIDQVLLNAGVKS